MVDASVGIRIRSSEFSLFFVFWSLSVAEEVFWMRGKDYTYLWVQGQIFRMEVEIILV